MILNETLTKIYKLDVENEEEKTIVKKRDLKNSIAGHMILNEQTLLDYNNTIKDDRRTIDVAYEVMLKYGVFDMPLKEIIVSNKKM